MNQAVITYIIKVIYLKKKKSFEIISKDFFFYKLFEKIVKMWSPNIFKISTIVNTNEF